MYFKRIFRFVDKKTAFRYNPPFFKEKLGLSET